MEKSIFDQLADINSRPEPFQFYTAEELWTDEHTSGKMLEYHLDGSVDLASRTRDFIDRSAAWIVSRFGLGKNKSVADFGCGPGLYTTLFAQSGARVTGIDFSERSIQYARKTAEERGLKIDYIQANYLDFDTDRRFDLITMIFCDFCALSPAQRRTLLAKFNELLKRDGEILLDVHSLSAFEKRSEAAVYEKNLMDHFWSPGDYYGFLNTFKYEKVKVILDKYTIVEENRTRVIYNWLQCFSPDKIQKEFEDSGFQFVDIYSDVSGVAYYPDSRDIAVVAVKSESE